MLPKVGKTTLVEVFLLIFFAEIELYRRKKLLVKRNSGASVSFMITTVKIGYVEMKVTANSPKNQDVAVKQLLVTVSIDYSTTAEKNKRMIKSVLSNVPE